MFNATTRFIFRRKKEDAEFQAQLEELRRKKHEKEAVGVPILCL